MFGRSILMRLSFSLFVPRIFATFELPCGRGVDFEIFVLRVLKILRFFSYHQLMLNKLTENRMDVFGGKKYQKSKGETTLLYNKRYENDVQ